MSDIDNNWYLSFDCATKTFAFSLIYIDFTKFIIDKEKLYLQYKNLKERLTKIELYYLSVKSSNLTNIIVVKLTKLVKNISDDIHKLDAETRQYINLADGETVDLFPDKYDKDISTVERIKATAKYVKSRIEPSIAKNIKTNKYKVIIEFQMGSNAKSRMISSALIALFADYEVILVGPSLKNKVSLRENSRYCYFIENRSTSYNANKAHTKYNFKLLEEVFGTKIPVSSTADRGHIADSVMQVIGYLLYGLDKKIAVTMF